jgi:hypothetical protein
MLSHIFLFGHRKQHGKDTVGNILEQILTKNSICFYRSYFAKRLKQHCAEKYNLDFSKMESNEYKNWCPPWINLKPDGNKRTVRDILIEEGNRTREIWEDCWINYFYKEIFNSNTNIAFSTDFRFPVEYKNASKYFTKNASPKIIKVLVHKTDGIIAQDGADNCLPDNDGVFWDHVIINKPIKNWTTNLKTQLEKILKKEKIIC